jgi:hypothetical protein
MMNQAAGARKVCQRSTTGRDGACLFSINGCDGNPWITYTLDAIAAGEQLAVLDGSEERRKYYFEDLVHDLTFELRPSKSLSRISIGWISRVNGLFKTLNTNGKRN